ncbi:MAG: DoxX family protein [bacterium]
MAQYRDAAGWIVLVLVAVVMLFAAAGKLFGFAPPMVMDQLTSYGLDDEILIIALAEAVSAVLLVTPRTWSLGILMSSAFWGGAIVAHLTGDDYFSAVAPVVLLVLTWAGSWLRHPETLSSFNRESHCLHS